MNFKLLGLAATLTLGAAACRQAAAPTSTPREQTAFQTSQPWSPSIDVRADVAIIYGVNPSATDSTRIFENRVRSWHDRGYTTHFMTGIAWGNYEDYFCGRWDGRTHMDEGQRQQNGDTIWHGKNVPYIVPTLNYLKYIKEEHIKRVIDAGIDAIFLEEPEFWTFAGYSEAFKREWKDFYGFDWRPQHESAENTYLSNKLKYHLYYRALNECFTFAKEYGRSKGMNVRCYVPTHSLINYSQWHIVSPEASIASMECVDGYIAQVWTGTSRVPNCYNGEYRERIFENAFMEYGCMESMTAPTRRKVFFLTDPIEDCPRDWADYKKSYEATFTAKLLYPRNNNYEVMPWPERIYNGLYQTRKDSDRKERISRSFSTQMQVMVNSLNHMPVSENRVSGSEGVSVLMGNSLMFQRTLQPIEGFDDSRFSDFYGLSMPFLKRGVPVSIVHIENTGYAKTWENTRVLLMTYSNMKPLEAEAHRNIARWVADGGTLVYCGRDDDAFQRVSEWWNTGDNDYSCPSAHLFTTLGLDAHPATGVYTHGQGKVYVVRRNPREMVDRRNADGEFVRLIDEAYTNATGQPLQFKNNFQLRRGAYTITSVMDESVSDEPLTLCGRFVDLFDPALPVVTQKIVRPGQQAFLYDLKQAAQPLRGEVVAAAARVYDEQRGDNSYSFTVKSPANTTNAMRLLLPHEPKVTLTDAQGHPLETFTSQWDAASGTLFLGFENSPEGVAVRLEW